MPVRGLDGSPNRKTMVDHDIPGTSRAQPGNDTASEPILHRQSARATGGKPIARTPADTTIVASRQANDTRLTWHANRRTPETRGGEVHDDGEGQDD